MAKSKRAFSPAGVPEKKDDYHGSCRFVRTSPDMAEKGVQSVNIELTFEEALRLSMAIQSAILRLNRYNRNDTKGRDMGLCLSLKVTSGAISVIEQRVRPADE